MQLLVVESSPGLAVLAAALLDDAAPGAFAVEGVPFGDQALDRLSAEGIDCVLVDLGAPDAGALEALDRILTASLSLPVVVLSARDDDEVALAAIRAGAQDHLVKASLEGGVLARSVRHAVERARIRREIAQQALVDPLTGLPNRTLFFDRLDQALRRVGRTETCLAVLFVDLDGFKAVNDAHGHAEGDTVLRAFAARLAGGLRGGDTAARIGGDEFVVLCEDIAGEEEARAIAARLLDQVGIPASMGIALASAADEDAQAVVRDADTAMYEVKRRGGAGLEVAGQPGRPRNASTIRGSNCEPEPSAIVPRARSRGQASL